MKIVNLICLQFVNHKQILQWWNLFVARNALLLVLEVYARTSVIPQSPFLNKVNLGVQDQDYGQYQGKVAYPKPPAGYGMRVSRCVTLDNNALVISHKAMWQAIILGKSLSHNNIIPFFGICVTGKTWVVWDTVEKGTLRQWRQSSNPPMAQIQGCVCLTSLHLSTLPEFFSSLR
jgi:hypothetical protein